MDLIHELFVHCCDTGGDFMDVITSQQEYDHFLHKLKEAGILPRKCVIELQSVWREGVGFQRHKGVVTMSFQDFTRGLLRLYYSPEDDIVSSMLSEIHHNVTTLHAAVHSLTPEDHDKLQLLIKILLAFVQESSKFGKDWTGMMQRIESKVYMDVLGIIPVPVEETTLPEAFYQANIEAIERHCAKVSMESKNMCDMSGRSRTVGLKLKTMFGHGERPVLGCTRSGVLVEMVELGKDTLLAHCAHRELVLSTHFPQWMGTMNSEFVCYEYIAAVPLVALIQQSNSFKDDKSPFAQHLIRQLSRALYDLSHQSSFHVDCSMLSEKDVLIADGGKRIVLGNVRWGEDLPEEEEGVWVREREKGLIEAYGRILSKVFTRKRGAKLQALLWLCSSGKGSARLGEICNMRGKMKKEIVTEDVMEEFSKLMRRGV